MKLTIGDKAPDLVNAFIEIPKGSNIKYEFDEENEAIKVDRVLYTSMSYPYNYGFIPGTLSEDGDPLDVLIISDSSFLPNTYIEVKPIGVLLMEDEEGTDYKIVAVPKAKIEQTYGNINDVNELPQFVKDKIKHFFEHYKELEPGKWVKLSGWASADEAKKKIQEAVNRLNNKK